MDAFDQLTITSFEWVTDVLIASLVERLIGCIFVIAI